MKTRPMSSINAPGGKNLDKRQKNVAQDNANGSKSDISFVKTERSLCASP